MKVILLQDIAHLGRKNDVKDVSDGYARNFLFPRGLAKPAVDAALRALAEEKVGVEKQKTEETERYKNLAGLLAGKTLTIKTRAGERGKTFGAVTPAKIRDALQREKIEVNKEWIELSGPIKQAGEYSIKIKFPYGIEGAIRIVIESEQ